MPQGRDAQKPSVSIVIPTFNEEAVIRQCLTAVLRQTTPALEIIVVDNSSTDLTVETVIRMQQEYLEENIILLHENEKQGVVPSRNLGFEYARGDVLGRIDADSLLEPGWVDQVQYSFQDPDTAAATGPVYYYDMPWHGLGLKIDNTMRRVVLKMIPLECRFLFGSNMALRRSAWELIRPDTCEDENDRMHEDIDLALHLAEHKLNISYVPVMVSGISARRLQSSPRDYLDYVSRFNRTYKAHNVGMTLSKIPMVLFLSIYFPLKALRAIAPTAPYGIQGLHRYRALPRMELEIKCEDLSEER